MKEQQIINEIVTSVTPELWWLFIQCLATILVTLLVYQLLKNISAYLLVRSDVELGKNVKVIVDGENGHIAYYNLRNLIVRLDNGNELMIPITRVRQMNWIIVKNGIKKK